MSPFSTMIAAAVDRLRAGGVVAFPTETVYGLGADAFNPSAIARVFELKGRPRFNPLIVHVNGPEMASCVCVFDERAARLSEALWPGPISIVLPKREFVPDLVTAGARTVGVRCPNHSVALALLTEFGSALVGPSANLSGAISPTRAEHVRAVWNAEQVMVLDGGMCTGGIESTVLSLVGPARILRAGLIGASEIERVLGERVEAPARGGGVAEDHVPGLPTPGERGALESPGQMSRHYAPRTRAVLVVAAEIESTSREHERATSIAEIGWSGRPLIRTGARVERFEMPDQPARYAAGLYEALHEADALGVQLLLIERPPPASESELWGAVLDRLVRATTPE